MLDHVKLRIHTPAKPAWLCAAYKRSLLGTIELFRQMDVALDIGPEVRDCAWIGHARAVINARFMASDCTHLLMIDADIGWNPEDVVSLLEHDRDLIGVAHPDRKRGECFVGRRPVVDQKDNGEIKEVVMKVDDGLIPCDRVSAAFIMHSRQAIERMMERHPELHAYRDAPWWLPGMPEAEQFFYGFWAQPVIDGYWAGEDHQFCDRAAEAGIQLYVDPFVRLSHTVEVEIVGSLAETASSKAKVRGMPNHHLRDETPSERGEHHA